MLPALQARCDRHTQTILLHELRVNDLKKTRDTSGIAGQSQV